MKDKISKKKQEGFTIIEVLIVLAIAGLIILIVFLAVPALQRNSRNTQRNNDVAALGGALTEYINNNNGDNPDDEDDFIGNANIGFYDEANVEFEQQASPNAPTAITDVNRVEMYNNAKCNGNDPTAADASSRSIIALYAVETGGGNQAQCKEL